MALIQGIRTRLGSLDWGLAVLLVAGGIAFALKCQIVAPIQWIGHAEEADYAEIAENLIQGRGISNDYLAYCYFISQFKYPEITHPDAHYPPLYAFLIVPFFLVLGKTAFAAKLPSLILSSLLLPPLVYLMTRRLNRAQMPALAAGLSALLFPEIFSHSLRPDDDILFPFMMLLSCHLLIKVLDDERYAWPAGIAMGLTYYTKGTGLLFLPAYLIFFGRARGWRALVQQKRKLLWFGVAILVMLPWFIRTTIHFGQPLFSTEQYAAGYIGYKSWEEGTYSLYWDQEMPSLIGKFREAGLRKVWQKSVRFTKQYLWWTFVDVSKKWGEFKWSDRTTYWIGLPALAGLLLFWLGRLNSLLAHLWKEAEADNRWGRLRRAVTRALSPWHRLEIYVLWMPTFILFAFVSICWEPIRRLSYPFILANMVLGWTTWHTLFLQTFAWTRWRRLIACLAIMLLFVPWLTLSVRRIHHNIEHAGWPYREGGQEWMAAGRWLKEHAPGSVTMTRNPWELHFYSGEKAIQIPRAELDKIIRVMAFYGVTHLIPQLDIRPTLKPLIQGQVPGARLVYDGKLKIYEIDLSEIP